MILDKEIRKSMPNDWLFDRYKSGCLPVDKVKQTIKKIIEIVKRNENCLAEGTIKEIEQAVDKQLMPSDDNSQKNREVVGKNDQCKSDILSSDRTHQQENLKVNSVVDSLRHVPAGEVNDKESKT